MEVGRWEMEDGRWKTEESEKSLKEIKFPFRLFQF